MADDRESRDGKLMAEVSDLGKKWARLDGEVGNLKKSADRHATEIGEIFSKLAKLKCDKQGERIQNLKEDVDEMKQEIKDGFGKVREGQTQVMWIVIAASALTLLSVVISELVKGLLK